MTGTALPERPIRAILDSSAIQSYGRGHVHVGEMITEIAVERLRVGVPAVALMDAYASFAGDPVARARLGILAEIPPTVVLALDRRDAEKAATVAPFAGNDLSLAHAAWAALQHRALLVTTEPEKSISALPGEQILTVPTDDV